MSYIENKMKKDLSEIMGVIETSCYKNGIISAFKKDPPKNEGFMWCSKEGGPGMYWNLIESNGLKQMDSEISNRGWDSSGYAIMFRALQNEVMKIYN